MMGGNFDRCGMVFKEPFLKDARNTKIAQPSTCLLGEVIRYFQVDVIRREHLLTCPTLIDNVGQLLRDIQAPAVMPTIIKPLFQLAASVIIDHINVQFALVCQTGERQVTATKVANSFGVGMVWIIE